MKKFPLLILLLHFLLSLDAQQTKPLNNQPYNIVLFIADDLGVNDIGPYGNKIVRTKWINNVYPTFMRFSFQVVLCGKVDGIIIVK